MSQKNTATNKDKRAGYDGKDRTMNHTMAAQPGWRAVYFINDDSGVVSYPIIGWASCDDELEVLTLVIVKSCERENILTEAGTNDNSQMFLGYLQLGEHINKQKATWTQLAHEARDRAAQRTARAQAKRATGSQGATR